MEHKPMSRQIFSVVTLTALLLAVSAWADEPKGASLPLNRVVLFSSGVGFFENSGKVQNDAKVEMKFKVDQINDCKQRQKTVALIGAIVTVENRGALQPTCVRVSKTCSEITAISLTPSRGSRECTRTWNYGVKCVAGCLPAS